MRGRRDSQAVPRVGTARTGETVSAAEHPQGQVADLRVEVDRLRVMVSRLRWERDAAWAALSWIDSLQALDALELAADGYTVTGLAEHARIAARLDAELAAHAAAADTDGADSADAAADTDGADTDAAGAGQ